MGFLSMTEGKREKQAILKEELQLREPVQDREISHEKEPDKESSILLFPEKPAIIAGSNLVIMFEFFVLYSIV